MRIAGLPAHGTPTGSTWGSPGVAGPGARVGMPRGS